MSNNDANVRSKIKRFVIVGFVVVTGVITLGIKEAPVVSQVIHDVSSSSVLGSVQMNEIAGGGYGSYSIGTDPKIDGMP